MMKQITGSIISKHGFYKTIAHKNTTSLKNNHKSHSYVQTSSKFQIKFQNQSVRIEEISISVSVITNIKVVIRNCMCYSSPSCQLF